MMLALGTAGRLVCFLCKIKKGCRQMPVRMIAMLLIHRAVCENEGKLTFHH